MHRRKDIGEQFFFGLAFYLYKAAGQGSGLKALREIAQTDYSCALLAQLP